MSDLRPDVVAGKYDASLFDATGEHLLVNEMFYSLQGEGLHSGRAALFIRLAKCNLACKFCDTEFETFERRTYQALATEAHYKIYHPQKKPIVVLTGGEPAIQNCDLLMARLRSHGFNEICVETSGSVWTDWLSRADHVCVSPKVHYRSIPDALKAKAGEFKWVVNQAFLSLFEKDATQVYHFGVPNFLQPESNHPKWIAAATKLIQRHPDRYRMSLQTHKLMSLP